MWKAYSRPFIARRTGAARRRRVVPYSVLEERRVGTLLCVENVRGGWSADRRTLCKIDACEVVVNGLYGRFVLHRRDRTTDDASIVRNNRGVCRTRRPSQLSRRKEPHASARTSIGVVPSTVVKGSGAGTGLRGDYITSTRITRRLFVRRIIMAVEGSSRRLRSSGQSGA